MREQRENYMGRVLMVLADGAAVDVSTTHTGRELSNLAVRLREIGDSDDEIAEAIADVCEQPAHPMLVSDVTIDGDDVILYAEDPEDVADAAERWMRKMQGLRN
jgi:hypothetical protein